MTEKIVKLYIYQLEGERVLVGVEKAQDFGDFIIVSIDAGNYQPESFEEMYQGLTNSFPDKKIIFVDKNLDIAFYGVKEVDEPKELTSAD